MKLIFCPTCRDVFKLSEKTKYCDCMKCWGYYVNNRHAVISTHAIPIGINNSSFSRALGKRTLRGEGRNFQSFTIGKDSHTIDVYGAESEAPKTTLKFKDWKANRNQSS